MKGMLRPVALLLVALMLAATCALAAAPEAGEDFYILDQAGVLSAGTKSAILEKNQSLNQSYGIQIVVVTVADLGSQGIQEYTQSILNQWKVGGDAQMGMVLVLDIAGENYYTIAGTGIRGKFTSAQLQELLDTYLEPGFAEDNYDDGVASYFAEVADRAESWAKEGAFQTTAPQAAQSAESGGPKLGAILWIVVGVALVAVSAWQLAVYFKKRNANA